MNFERLPNELLCDVFGYIHAIDVFHAFYGLNERFNQLLIQFPSHHVDFRNVSRVQFADFCHRHLPRILSRVHSVHVSGDDSTAGLPEEFLTYGSTLDQLVHLRSLTLESIQEAITVNQIMFQCTHLNHLRRLRVVLCAYDYDGELLERIWTLPSLKSYTGCRDPFAHRSETLMLTDISSSIERLVLNNFRIPFNSLVFILKHTPHLQHLQAHTIARYGRKTLDIPPLRLTSMRLSYDSTSIEDLIALLRQMPRLRRIILDIGNLFVSGCELEWIIVTHLPQLECFQFKMEFQPPPGCTSKISAEQIIRTFQSSFWTEKHAWFFRCEWSADERFDDMILSTISYPFHSFTVKKHRRSKSTLPERHSSLYSALRVENLSFRPDYLTTPQPYIGSFSHVHFLEMCFPCSDALLALIPHLNQLSLLNVYAIQGEDGHSQLQTILDRAARVHQLRFPEHGDRNLKLAELKSPSVRGLIFSKQLDYNVSWNQEHILTLATSSLGQQCRSLVIYMETLESIRSFLNLMPNLCFLKCYQSTLAHDEVLDWLNNAFPEIAWSSRMEHKWIAVLGWIR